MNDYYHATEEAEIAAADAVILEKEYLAFGNEDAQDGDGTPTITQNEQVTETVEKIRNTFQKNT